MYFSDNLFSGVEFNKVNVGKIEHVEEKIECQSHTFVINKADYFFIFFGISKQNEKLI